LNRPGPLRSAAVASSLCLAGFAVARGQEGAEPPIFAGTAQVTAVELVAEVRDRDGRVPPDLAPIDFEVLEDGIPVHLIAVEPFRAVVSGEGPVADSPSRRLPGAPEATAWRWRLVVWFDQELSSSRSIRRAAESLAEQAAKLTALGSVEIVLASGDLRVHLSPTRSSTLVEQALRAIARDVSGRDRLREIRRRYFDLMLLKGELDGRNMPRTVRLPGGSLEAVKENGAVFSRRNAVRAAVVEEHQLISRRQDLLTSWIAVRGEPGPKALLLINDGWDVDPREFYLTGSPTGQDFWSDVAGDLAGQSSGAPVEVVARSLAASGWVTISVASGALDAGSSIGAEHSGRGRLGEIVAGSDDALTELPSALVVRPLAPLDQYGDETGGETLTGVGSLPGAIARLADRVRFVYQVDRMPDAKQRRIEVRPRRPGLEVRAARWTGGLSGEIVAAARARSLAAGESLRGDLPLSAAIGVEPDGTEAHGEAPERIAALLQARLDLTPVRPVLARTTASTIRVTIAVSFPDGPPFVHRDEVAGQPLAGLSAWTYRLPLTLPGRFERVAVVLEESQTGAWGSAVAARVESRLPEAVADALAPVAAAFGSPPAVAASRLEADEIAALELLPEPKPLLLPPPPADPVAGKSRLEPLLVAPEVARVDYLLDGERAGTSSRPPFEVEIDLGPLPVARAVEAIARDAGGLELGRDRVHWNAGAAPFAVRIVEPRTGRAGGGVDVEAELSLPADAELDRLEIRWNDRTLATLYEPPFRQRVEIPTAAGGALAVVAGRRDGERVEDVRLLNVDGGGESVEVRLVELVAAVRDGSGAPVSGLGPDEFVVAEEGRAQELAAVRDGSELPLTLGLAIDSSASLFEEMTAVQSAAIDFLAMMLEPRDRAFVVDFDSTPRLAADLTGELSTLFAAVAGLKPGGATALCDAIVYSLARLQRVRGRRALVVLSDGVGRDDRVPLHVCQRFAERSGVPIYLLVLPERGPAEPGRRAADEARLARVVEPTGGRIVAVESIERLGAIYRSLAEELAAQYVLSYYAPTGSVEPSAWRRVSVTAARAGLTVRAPPGYVP
jgi:VWFA-related protein